MESHNGTEEVVMGMRGSKSTNGSTPSAAGSRWNPTKEQIVMLENLYNQGIRTPSEEQIQQITSRLKAYGHIEGKNVFYWFQNHKARQRQKQKQESIAYFNRFINASQPLFSNPLCHNVVYPPYCLPPNDISFYSQHPNVVVPGFIVPRTEKVVPLRMPGICDGQQIYQQFQQRIPGHEYSNNNHETLTLFPLHPTGILDTKTNDQVSSVASITGRSSCSTDIDASPENQPFFNFFASGQASRVSDN